MARIATNQAPFMVPYDNSGTGIDHDFPMNICCFLGSFSDKPTYQMVGCISYCTPGIFPLMAGCYTHYLPIHGWILYPSCLIGFISVIIPFLMANPHLWIFMVSMSSFMPVLSHDCMTITLS